jgi:hypothetical protein
LIALSQKVCSRCQTNQTCEQDAKQQSSGGIVVISNFLIDCSATVFNILTVHIAIPISLLIERAACLDVGFVAASHVARLVRWLGRISALVSFAIVDVCHVKTVELVERAAIKI